MSAPIWNDKEEIYLKKLHYQSRIMHMYFNKKYLEYSNVHKKYHIPIMILSSMNSLFCITLPQFMDQAFVSILNSVISAGVGILGSILLYMKIDQKIQTCHSVSLAMNNLTLKISKELSIDRDKRSQCGIVFLNESFNEYIGIIEKSLPLDKKIKNFIALEDLENINTPSEFSSPPSSPAKMKHSPFSLTTFQDNSSDGSEGITV
jgi:hypothetical protein